MIGRVWWEVKANFSHYLALMKYSTCTSFVAHSPHRPAHDAVAAPGVNGRWGTFGRWREAIIFNVKYIIHECGLLTICRPPPGRYLLGRYTYTGLQHFLGQAQLLYGMCAEKRNMSNKYTYLTIISPPSQTALPINHQRVHCKTLLFVFLHHPVQILPVPAKELASAMWHSGTEMLQL